MASSSDTPVTLANCEDEPIHLPGAIQPHGALIALSSEGRVLSRSANLEKVAGFDMPPGTEPDSQLLGNGMIELIAEGLANDDHWVNSVESILLGRLFDVVAHRYQSVLYLELEPRRTASASFSQFALYAQRIISQMQSRHDIDSLLSRVTDEIRNMTGFDRVMAYRFRPDLSGEVIAEARRSDLESYLGQRYPASDIPAQARLLYIQNPIRLIADVAYAPSPLMPGLNPQTGKPFDLSFSSLRSVSPIHCEYLTNMGVRASMSVSIVVGGKLWGLFSCHHMAPKTMAHPLRMSFQVISQVCSALVERLEHNLATQTLKRASEQQQALILHARDSEDLVAALSGQPDNIAALVPCDGAAVVMSGRTQSIGGQFDLICRQIIEHLEQDGQHEVFHTDHWQSVDTEGNPHAYCGVLAVRFHRQESGWIIWLRKEEIHHVRWGGKPEKIVRVGPSGPRLTPRGSFEAWEEVVRGRSPSWTDTEIEIAEKLRRDLVELCLSRASEIDGMRQRLIAMLGHDLRNPLQSISMAAAMLSSSEIRDTELRKHISHSSGRMERLISQILEMSRLQSGLGILVNRVDTDLSALVQSIVAETAVAFPGMTIDAHIAPDVRAMVDPDRYAQVITNLLGNARYHGTPGKPVLISLSLDGNDTRLSVLNETNPVPAERLGTLFQPFKPQSADNLRNKNGLGIGLYISQAIAAAHSGQISVEQSGNIITFSMVQPMVA
jgi:light-regulated signal transduction histidine kinase (bacteriophytochrome)